MDRDSNQILTRQAKFISTLRTAGMPDSFYQQVIDDVEFRVWLVGLTKEKLGLSYKETEMQKEARKLMGVDFHGIPEVERYFGELTEVQRKLAEVIPEKIVADICAMTLVERNKYILEYDTGISLVEIRRLARKGLFYSQDWYNEKKFAERTEVARWRLIRKIPVDSSFSKSWNQQERLINSQINEIPSARQVVYTMILHFLSTGERLFEKCYVRTSDVNSYGRAGIGVGSFDSEGLVVYLWNDDGPSSGVGVASARKTNS
jgi:hypothetical protein